jgi:hypothetical protein
MFKKKKELSGKVLRFKNNRGDRQKRQMFKKGEYRGGEIELVLTLLRRAKILADYHLLPCLGDKACLLAF